MKPRHGIWKEVYELRGMICYIKALLKYRSQDLTEDQIDIYNELIHEYEDRINELIGV